MYSVGITELVWEDATSYAVSGGVSTNWDGVSEVGGGWDDVNELEQGAATSSVVPDRSSQSHVFPDYILYSPTSTTDHDEYVDYYWSDGHVGSGEFEVSFFLLNLRTDYELRYFRRGPDAADGTHTYGCIGVGSQKVSFENQMLEPTQG